MSMSGLRKTVWLLHGALAAMILAPGFAWADNCGGLSDCYGVLKAAITVVAALALVAAVVWAWPIFMEVLTSEAAIGSQATLVARMGIEEVMANAVQEGEGITIAGGNTGTVLQQAIRLSQTYGGQAGDWLKMTTKDWVLPDGTRVQLHYYFNQITKEIVEMKWKVMEVSGLQRGMEIMEQGVSRLANQPPH